MHIASIITKRFPNGNNGKKILANSITKLQNQLFYYTRLYQNCQLFFTKLIFKVLEKRGK